MMRQSLLVHATSVALGENCVLLRGPSGSGKSDLALRLIDGGAVLVADDQTRIAPRDGQIVAAAPPAIAGLIEARGVGLLSVDYRAEAVARLVFDLVPGGPVERLPEPETVEYFGIEIPLLRLDPFTPSAAAKVRLAVASLGRDKLFSP
jgi:HPr kinase/phosphorylase